MEIYFDMEHEFGNNILIKCRLPKGKSKVIGHIFTPGGTSHDKANAIQVCGFDRAFQLWGCGIFVNSKGKHKQDIQLLFSEDSEGSNGKTAVDSECGKCFNKSESITDIMRHTQGTKCTCNELVIADEKDLPIERVKKKQ